MIETAERATGYPRLIELDPAALCNGVRLLVCRAVLRVQKRRAQRAITRFEQAQSATRQFQADWRPVLFALTYDRGMALAERNRLMAGYVTTRRDVRQKEGIARESMWRACVAAGAAQERVKALCGGGL